MRGVFFLNLGSLGRCLQLWVSPGFLGLDWREGFEALEQGVLRVTDELSAMSYAELLHMSEEDLRDRETPRVGDRQASVYVFVMKEGETLVVLVCGDVRFRFWQLGGWFVVKGLRLSPTVRSALLSEKKLDDVWLERRGFPISAVR